MNLPTHIQFAGGQNITYRYDAAGIKLQKTVDDGTRQVTTDYMSGYQYEDGKLLFFPTPEGYVKAIYKPGDNTAPALYQYIYIYKDHLGNNRLSYTLDPESERVKILEENHYYPFGLKHNAYVPTRKDVKYQEQLVEKKEIKQIAPEEGKYKYYYQEQERQDELGLNWDSFKYRNYDYAIGRFMSIDPLAEKYPYNGVYNFSENRVIDGRELEGLEYISTDAILQAKNNTYKKKTSNSRSWFKVGTGVQWSSTADGNSGDSPSKQEKEHIDNHQPWYVDMDGLNILREMIRPSIFNNTNTKNIFTKVAEIAQKDENIKEIVDYITDKNNKNNTTETDTPPGNENKVNTDNSSNNSGAENNSKEVLKDTVYEIHGPNNSKTYKLHLNQSSQADRNRVTDSLEKEAVLIRK